METSAKNVLNNREIATLVWIGVLAVWLLRKPEVRSSLSGLPSAVLTPKILVPLLAMVAYIVGLVAIGSRAGLWSSDLLKDTIVWAVGPAIVLFLGVADAGTNPHFFRRAVLRTVAFTAFMEFYVNLYVFSLLVELIFVPVVTVVILLGVVAGTDAQYAGVKKFLNVLTSIVGLGLLVSVTARLIQNRNHIDVPLDLKTLALPVWLTIGVMPYLYVLSMYASYEMTFLRVRFATDSPIARRRAKLALALGLNVRLHAVSTFGHPWLQELTSASSFAEAREVIRRYRTDYKRRADTE